MMKRHLSSLALLAALHASTAAGLSEVICIGDCDYDHTAAINELITGVSISLGEASIETCRGFDPSGDGTVSIDELIGGVGNALDSCPLARLERADCDIMLPAGQNPAGVQCGSVVVREDRARNDGRTVRIPFAVFKATDADPARDPLIYLSGGPGGPSLDFVQNNHRYFAPFQAERDIVFFDQRGTGRSTPSLDCPEWRQAFSTYIAAAQSVDEDVADLVSSVRTCHDRLMSEGVNFAAYTSSASAHDVEEVMLALGYEEWNVYGLSYGTRLGLTAMRDTPAHIRSIGLDSNVPVQENLHANWAADFERSLNTLFAGCATDPACNAAFPNLEQTFFALVAELDANPVTVTPMNPATGQPFPVVVTGARLLLGIQGALYDTALIPFLPLAIANTARGDYALLTAASAQIAAPSPSAWAMYYSIECNEEIPFNTPEIIAAAHSGVRQEIKTVGLAYITQSTIDVCAFWGSPPPPAFENEPVVSDIPALVLAGEYDPITRPSYGQLVAETLAHGSYFELPGTGHGVLRGRLECASEMVSAFLADPTQPPDASCIGSILPPQFAGT